MQKNFLKRKGENKMAKNILRLSNTVVMAGTVKDVKSGISQAGNPYVLVTVTRLQYDESMAMDLEVENNILFMDNDYVTWTEKIENMKIAPGANVAIRANVSTNDKNEETYFGSLITYLNGAGVDIQVKTKNPEPEKDDIVQRVIIGKIGRQYCKYDAQKGIATIPVSVRKYNPDSTEEDKNYFCNFNLKSFDDKKDETKKYGQQIYKQFVGKKDDETIYGIFVVNESSKFVSDKQKDAEHPTAVYYNIVEYDVFNMPPKAEK